MLRRKWTRTFIWNNLAGAHRLKGDCRRPAAGGAGVHRREMPPSGGGERPCPRPGVPGFTGGNKRGQDTRYGFLSPLDSPDLPLRYHIRDVQRNGGYGGLGSVRRFALGTLLCPEFPLRYPPRITVRGHSVQGGSVALRKTPLRSRVLPWGTKRHCGPLVFRRATEGSRVQRRVWGRQEGAREPYGALAPFCLRRQTAAMPGLPIGSHSRLQRQAAVSAEGLPSADRKIFIPFLRGG